MIDPQYFYSIAIVDNYYRSPNGKRWSYQRFHLALVEVREVGSVGRQSLYDFVEIAVLFRPTMFI